MLRPVLSTGRRSTGAVAFARRYPRTATMLVAMLGSALFDLLAPPRCLACRVRSAGPWCSACVARIDMFEPACRRCAAPRGGPHRCWPANAPISSTSAAYDYRGPVAQAVVTAKLRGAWAGWPPLGRLLAEHVARRPPAVDAVTWVTAAPPRRRRRGFDHAAILAEAVAHRLEVPVIQLLAVRCDGGQERFQARGRLPGSELLLVDDVMTTGVTANAAAGELRDAGAGRIHLAVLARAGTHALSGGITTSQPRPGPEGTASGGRTSPIE